MASEKPADLELQCFQNNIYPGKDDDDLTCAAAQSGPLQTTIRCVYEQ